ncbi:MAG: cytochrome c oxidase subunit II [Alphaproteobacteria bacterium]|jgi:cytochrome c oxidase subunit 2|nr:cytochrome c oxidase subunit II [Alphaproteobacteria bacterium]
MTASRIFAALGTLVATGAGFAAAAQAAGLAEPWQLGLQDAATPVMRELNSFHNMLLVLIFVIAIFVMCLLLYCMVKFNAKSNPTPTKTSHNTLLEVIWTAVPVLILVVIAIPSFKLLYFADRAVDAEMTIKAIGHQWYWSYEYPDHDDLTFDATMLEDDERTPDQPRLLATDNAIVVPVDTSIRLLTTSDDVIHSWAMPAFGVKLDAVPGRINETWMKVEAPGMYYGMCSELCGVRHGFMPIMVKAVPKDEFKAWVEKAKKEFARSGDETPLEVARINTASAR